MKIRNLYLLIIFGVIVVWILIYSSSKVGQLELPELKVKEAKKFQAPEIIGTFENPILPSRGVITVIKPVARKERLLSETNKAEEIFVAQKPAPLFNEVNAVAGQSSNSSAGEEQPTTGITRLSKYPSKEKIKEMNSSGIVMY